MERDCGIDQLRLTILFLQTLQNTCPCEYIVRALARPWKGLGSEATRA